MKNVQTIIQNAGRPCLKRIPVEEKNKVLRNMSAYNAASKTATTLEWTEIGPNTIGGRTRAILIDPNDSTNKTVFAAGVSGGLWKTKISQLLLKLD